MSDSIVMGVRIRRSTLAHVDRLAQALGTTRNSLIVDVLGRATLTVTPGELSHKNAQNGIVVEPAAGNGALVAGSN